MEECELLETRGTEKTSGFTVGSILRLAWKTLWEKPLAFFGYTLLSLLLTGLVSVALAWVPMNMVLAQNVFDGLHRLVLFFITLIVEVFMAVGIYLSAAMLFQGVITRAALWGDAAAGREGLKRFAGRIGAVFVPALCAFAEFALVMSVCVLLGVGLYMLFVVSRMIDGDFGYFLGAIAISALIYIIIFFAKWLVLAPVCAFERLGYLAARRRAADLMKGRRLKLYGISCVGWTVISYAVGTCYFRFMSRFMSSRETFSDWALYVILPALIILILLTYLNVLPATVYYHLRSEKENLTPEDWAGLAD